MYLDAQQLEPNFPVKIPCYIQIAAAAPWKLKRIYIYIYVAITFSENEKDMK